VDVDTFLVIGVDSRNLSTTTSFFNTFAFCKYD